MVGLNKYKLSNVSTTAWVVGALLLGVYFTYHTLQGEYGIFSRIQVNDEAVTLQKELDEWNDKIKEMQNLTLRLSDNYLDLELLDERAREVLGYIRKDEIIIN